MSFEELSEKFDSDLEAINILSSNILERSTMAINLSRDLLYVLKIKILKDGFRDKNEEINFFKHIKQTPLIPLIYYSEIRSFEIQFPKGNVDCQRKYIKKKINKINRFFLYNMDFEQYIDSKHTHFDLQYYTRDYLETYNIVSSEFYFQDPDFSTPRDMLLGKSVAYSSLVSYLDDRLHNLEFRLMSTEKFLGKTEKLIWPFTNTDWVELVYALSSAGITKQNSLSINKVSKIMEKVFDFTPKDIYKTYQDIKNRKNSRTLFLDELTTCLLTEMIKSEE